MAEIFQIGSKILCMLNFLSQHIACDFKASQRLWNTPSQVCSIAACGPGYILPRAHAAMLYTCDGTLNTSCDALELHAMYCNAISNMLDILLPVLSYRSFRYI